MQIANFYHRSGLHKARDYFLPLARGAAIVLVVALLSASTASAQSGPPLANIVSWWPADGNGMDIVGPNDGTLLGGAAFATGYVTSGTGQAFSLDGVDDRVEIPDHPSLDSGVHSAAAWIKVDSFACTTPQRILEKIEGQSTGWTFDILCDNEANPRALRLVSFNQHNAFSEAAIGSSVPQNEWTHVGYTWDGNELFIYMNGEVVHQDSWLPGVQGPTLPNTLPLKIGYSPTCCRFDGLIDDVLLFSGAISHDLMVGLYEAGVNGLSRVAPTVIDTTAPPEPVVAGATVMATASFVSPDGNASSATIDWGDGTSSAATLDLSAGTLTGQHAYDDPGVYTLQIGVTDASGNVGAASHQYVVVYDPDGGFVTGGGWIDSPAGAYVADTDLTGKATFGFVSKYHNGANVPEGNTQFQFKAADLRFRATEYDWLVTPGQDKGKFKGSGTVNGGGDYGFMLTVVDNGNSGDTFRMKIWDKSAGDGVVYDNKLGSSGDGYDGTAIGGGNIKVHRP